MIDAMAYANGSAVAEIEVDTETGRVTVLALVISHDCGRVLNPMIVEGQVLGGAAHGIGNALFEWMGYDDAAQPVTTSFGEYLLPGAASAADRAAAPGIAVAAQSARRQGRGRMRRARRCPPPSPAPIEDALSPFGVRIAQAPIRPHEIVALVNRSRSSR